MEAFQVVLVTFPGNLINQNCLKMYVLNKVELPP